MRPVQAPCLKYNTRGFTLIEILVVVVIISISIGVVVVNINTGSTEAKAKEEITRLQQLLKFAHQQSVIRAEDYGLRFYTTGYRFMKYNEEEDLWEDLSDKLFRYRLLDDPLEIDLYIEQTPVDLLNSIDDDPEVEPEEENKLATTLSNDASNIDIKKLNDAKKEIRPQVFLLSSSELEEAFELRIRVPGTDIEEHLEGLPQGEYKRVLNDDF